MRRLRFAAAATIAVVALALTGCASTTPAPEATSGAAVDAVQVSGSLGSKPTVSIPTPLVTETTECNEVIAGHGDYVQSGQMVTVELSVYNGTNGSLIQQTDYDGSNSQNLVVSDQMLAGLKKGLTCGREGSRVVVVIPPTDAFGDSGYADWNITATDSLVIVIDFTQVFLARANGTPQLSQDGMPMVVLAPNGQPGVSIPSDAAPSSERISVLKKGNGATVQSGQKVTVHYEGLIWATKAVFDSSWTTGTPVQFTVGDGVKDQGEVIQGFSNAIIGQTVGSQILAVIPPDLGYGSTSNSTIPANSTLVFVIDILGVS